MRQAHNSAALTAISDVARILRAHVDARDLEAALVELPLEAEEFWSVFDDAKAYADINALMYRTLLGNTPGEVSQ